MHNPRDVPKLTLRECAHTVNMWVKEKISLDELRYRIARLAKDQGYTSMRIMEKSNQLAFQEVADKSFDKMQLEGYPNVR